MSTIRVPRPELRRQLLQTVEAYQLKRKSSATSSSSGRCSHSIDAGPGGLTARTSSAIPAPRRRNLVNSYVWTADGGTFAETNDVMDSMSESVGGYFSFATMLGANVTADIMFATSRSPWT